MKFEPVIGLEIHVQLKTNSKMFCRCSNRGEFEAPNTTVCSICLGHPGTLPMLNRRAVEYGVLAGLAIGGRIAEHSKFDRKNYFYPDLPKGYQISQFDLPIVDGGVITVNVPDGQGASYEKTVRFERIHLEEDAAKLTHSADGKASYVDFNRGGTPLIECVTRPDMRSPAEAKAFLQELRLIMRYLGVSDADMEKGHLRCDANVSLRPIPDHPENDDWKTALYPKTEVKNVNSFRSVERAIDFEIKRQTKLWLDDNPPSQSTTRGWDDERGITIEQRTKEGSSDYRFFPEPDLPPLELAGVTAEMSRRLPELPAARRERLAAEYGFSPADARTMADDKDLGEFAERVFGELEEWASSATPGLSAEEKAARRPEFAKLVAGWILTKLRGVMTEHRLTAATVKITPENFAELLALLYGKKVTGQNALVILAEMALSGADPSVIMTEKNLGQMQDDGALSRAAAEAVAANPKAVLDWRSGKASAVQFLVGQVMRTTSGKAEPNEARAAIEAELGKA
jgi:aspartyl-tRNA(Asn)/glutamyl-tRNA(Gln) amidotransferase subunit B